jgi:hypothetical protein
MAINDYTTFADIRAVIGVNDIELPNAVLELDVYSLNLTAEIEDVDITIPAKFVEVGNVIETTRSAAQRRFYDSCRTFATYAVAKQLSSSLPMFGPKDVSDSKTSITRFSDSPYKETAKKIESAYDLNKSRLVKAFGDVISETRSLPTRTMLVISSPTTDRVTG